MTNKINYTIVKDILIEQWNEGELSPEEVISVYESTNCKNLENTEKEKFLILLKNWNEYGIQKFLEVEKLDLAGKEKNSSKSELFVEQFIQQYL